VLALGLFAIWTAPLRSPPAVGAEPERLAASLCTVTAMMHERGVYHLDLRQRQNLLVAGVRSEGARRLPKLVEDPRHPR